MTVQTKDIINVGSLKALSILITLSTTILFARLLGPQQYGTFAFLVSIVTLLSLPISNGLSQFLSREISKLTSRSDPQAIRELVCATQKSVAFYSAVLILPVLGMGLWNTQWQVHLGTHNILLAFLILPLWGLISIRSGILRGMRMPTLAQAPELLCKPLCMLAALIPCWYISSLDLEGALLIHLGSMTATLILAAMVATSKFPQATAFRPLPSPAHHWKKPLLIIAMIATISGSNQHIALVTVGFLSDADQVAAYKLLSAYPP